MDRTCLSDWTEILGIKRPSQHLEFIAVFLKRILNHVCSVAQRVILRKEDTGIRKYRFQDGVYVVCSIMIPL